MELKVWVEGLPRVVCGVSDQTTCQDVVIALAHASGKIGRFTLIEKWRENERLLSPTEQPLKVLHKWGEYAADVQFILKHSGGKGKPERSGRRTEKQNNPPLPQQSHFENRQGSGIKRNLTFSGAHSQFNAPRLIKKANGGPVANSSLESLEERSSVTSVSSRSSVSPYASLEKRRGGKGPPTNPLSNHHNNKQTMDHSPQSSYSSTCSPPSEDTPCGSPERKPHKAPLSPVSVVPAHNNNNYTKSQPSHDRLVGRPGKGAPFITPRIQVEEYDLELNLCPSNNNTLTKDTQLSPKNRKQDSGLGGSPPNEQSDTQPVTSTSVQSERVWEPSGRQSQVQQPGRVSEPPHRPPGRVSEPPQRPPQLQPGRVSERANGQSEAHSQGPQPRHRETQSQQSAEDVSKEHLIKLVNLQLDKLKGQDSHMKQLDSEMCSLEQRYKDLESYRKDTQTELQKLAELESECDNELEELELVSWDDKVELEKHRSHHLRSELTLCQSKLDSKDLEIVTTKHKEETLVEEVETEANKVRLKEQSEKGLEVKLLQEISDLQKQINQKLVGHEQNQVHIDELQSGVKTVESEILVRKTQVADLERDLADANMAQFRITPTDFLRSREGRAFDRHSPSRPGSARKMTHSPHRLKETAPTLNDPHGLWV